MTTMPHRPDKRIDPRLREHVTAEEAARYLRGEIDDDELVSLPSLEDKQRECLWWWKDPGPSSPP